MQFRVPKDSDRYEWTWHVVAKMRHYGLGEGVIKRVIRAPHRIEESIAPGTLAHMQPRRVQERAGGKPHKWREEVWVMYRELGSERSPVSTKKRVISAWRYPGMSPVGEPIPIPDEIIRELEGEEV